MASAVDKQPAAARLSAVAAAGCLPTATRGSQSSYTTLWDTTGWGDLGSRGYIRNPLTILSKAFESRDAAVGFGGGFTASSYFSGERASLFGGIEYQTPVRGLSLKGEYDGNNYSREPLQGFNNIIAVSSPFNYGMNYRPFSWARPLGGDGAGRGRHVSSLDAGQSPRSRHTQARSTSASASPRPPAVSDNPTPAERAIAEAAPQGPVSTSGKPDFISVAAAPRDAAGRGEQVAISDRSYKLGAFGYTSPQR